MCCGLNRKSSFVGTHPQAQLLYNFRRHLIEVLWGVNSIKIGRIYDRLDTPCCAFCTENRRPFARNRTLNTTCREIARINRQTPAELEHNNLAESHVRFVTMHLKPTILRVGRLVYSRFDVQLF